MLLFYPACVRLLSAVAQPALFLAACIQKTGVALLAHRL